MKANKGLKIALIILIIILITMISFVGIYVQKNKSMVNVIADYKLGMDLKGYRDVSMKVSDSTNKIYYDKDGNIVESEVKGGTTKEEPINSEESLTKENYAKVKEIIEKRFSDLSLLKYYKKTGGVSQLKLENYLIKLDENTGKIDLQLLEDDTTPLAVQYMYTVGKFEVEGENGEIFFNNSDIKEATVLYNTTNSGTVVLLNIEFNENCIEKISEITKTYVTTTDEKGKDTSKKIILKVDGSELISTSFDEEVTDGVLSISVGGNSTSNEAISAYASEAIKLAVILNNEPLPISYDITQNRYVKSDIQIDDLKFASFVLLGILIISVLVLGVIYKKNGILVGISNIGYISLLLILIRYTNVAITIEGLYGIITSIILNYFFNIYILEKIKRDIKIGLNKELLNMVFIFIPAIVISILFSFMNWMPIYSFGQTIFWGLLLIFIYNIIFTMNLLNSVKKN